MIAYKAFRSDLTCTMGRGIFQYREHEVHREPKANCAENGFHCAENPLDCLRYYPDWKSSVYYMVEAGGDIDEDDIDTKISCTELTLLKKLTLQEFVAHAVSYMAKHPNRGVHYRDYGTIHICREEYASQNPNMAVIVRGKNPKAAAGTGCIVALVQEEAHTEEIKQVKLYHVDGKNIKEGIVYSLRKKVAC